MATVVASALPDVTLMPGHRITVTLDDALAKITKLNVYAVNLETGALEEILAVPPILAYIDQP